MKNRKTVYQERILTLNLKVLILACIALWFAAYLISDLDYFVIKLLENLFLTLSSILGVSVVWELICKKDFTDYIYNKCKISSSIKEAHISEVYTEFSDIEWDEELKNVNTFFGFITYGSTLLHSNIEVFKRFTKNHEMIIVVPDHNNEQVVDALDRLYGYGKYSADTEKPRASVKFLIQNAIDDYSKVGAKVRIYNDILYTSFFMLDNRCILSPTKQRTEYRSVPSIMGEKGGCIYEFCDMEREYIMNKSCEVSR